VRRYLLDASPLAGLLLARPAIVGRVQSWMIRHEVATSILVYGEVIEHVRGRPDFEARRDDLQALLGEVHPYPLDYSIMERYADLRRRMRPPYGGGLIGDVDTLIAATALEHDLTLVTMDRHFERVPDVKLMLLPRASA
jgi:predicted nucleic acid-binding protein